MNKTECLEKLNGASNKMKLEIDALNQIRSIADDIEMANENYGSFEKGIGNVTIRVSNNETDDVLVVLGGIPRKQLSDETVGKLVDLCQSIINDSEEYLKESLRIHTKNIDEIVKGY